MNSLSSSQLSIPSRGQISIFVPEFLTCERTFKRSMVLSGQGGFSFAAADPVIEAQGLTPTIPAIPGKAPQIPQ